MAVWRGCGSGVWWDVVWPWLGQAKVLIGARWFHLGVRLSVGVVEKLWCFHRRPLISLDWSESEPVFGLVVLEIGIWELRGL